jgi:DNA-directed RNA polymerase specialized sigma subunit
MQNTAASLTHGARTSMSPESPPNRDDLVQHALPLGNTIAERLRRVYTQSASLEDLCAMGMSGLATAFDRIRSVPRRSFITFQWL